MHVFDLHDYALSWDKIWLAEILNRYRDRKVFPTLYEVLRKFVLDESCREGRTFVAKKYNGLLGHED